MCVVLDGNTKRTPSTYGTAPCYACPAEGKHPPQDTVFKAFAYFPFCASMRANTHATNRAPKCESARTTPTARIRQNTPVSRARACRRYQGLHQCVENKYHLYSSRSSPLTPLERTRSYTDACTGYNAERRCHYRRFSTRPSAYLQLRFRHTSFQATHEAHKSTPTACKASSYRTPYFPSLMACVHQL